MRLITRKQFLQIPGRVLYSKYRPSVFEGWCIKLGNMGDTDWNYDSLDPGEIDHVGADQCDLFDQSAEEADQPTGTQLPMDFGYTSRDGSYEPDNSLIAVYTEEDVLTLVERLMELLPNHQLVEKVKP